MARFVRHILGLTSVLVVLTGFAPTASVATGPRAVSLELVLAIDASISVNDSEFNLQLRGIADAFRRREIIDLIKLQNKGVAVTLVQWSGWAQSHPKPPWRLLTNNASVLSFADEIERIERQSVGYLTGIGQAVDYSADLIETNAFDGRERKIDVSGDGRNNVGPEPAVARERALLQGITINGLAILTDDADLHGYYESEVVGGPASFVISASTYDDFALAMAKKLTRELTILTAFKSGPRPGEN